MQYDKYNLFLDRYLFIDLDTEFHCYKKIKFHIYF